MSDRLTPAVAVLDPVQVDHAEGGGGDARSPVVVVFVDVQVEGGIAVHVVRAQTGPQSLLDGLVAQPLLQLGGSTDVVNDALLQARCTIRLCSIAASKLAVEMKRQLLFYLDVVCYEDLAQVEDLQHGGGVVVADAVALQHVLGGGHLPGQPALAEGGVERQDVREVAGLTAAAALVLLHALCDGLYLPLLAVGTCADNGAT